MPDINYTKAIWTKTVFRGGRTLERRYAVRVDATVITRLDSFDLQRSFASLVTDGWKVHPTKRKFRTLNEAIRKVATKLEPRGYKRLI